MEDLGKLFGINNFADCTRNDKSLSSLLAGTANEKNGFEIELPPIQLDPNNAPPTIETQFWSSLLNDYSDANVRMVSDNSNIISTTCSYPIISQPIVQPTFSNNNQSHNMTTQNKTNSKIERFNCKFFPSHKIIDALDELSITIQNLKKCLSNK